MCGYEQVEVTNPCMSEAQTSELPISSMSCQNASPVCKSTCLQQHTTVNESTDEHNGMSYLHSTLSYMNSYDSHYT